MSARIFLKQAQLEGQSKVLAFENDVVILEVNFGVSNFTDFSSGNTGTGNVHVQNVSCTKKVDAASTTLAKVCAARLSLDKVVITYTLPPSETSPKPYEFVRYELTNAVVTAVSHSIAGDDTLEHFSLHFTSIFVEIKPQGATLKPGADHTFRYDVQSQVASSA